MDVCTDDAYCNDGVSNICDIENSPYTTCFYCEGGECKPGEQLIILFSLFYTPIQDASLMPIVLVDTLARIISATILLGRFSSSRSRSEHKPAAPIAQRRESRCHFLARRTVSTRTECLVPRGPSIMLGRPTSTGARLGLTELLVALRTMPRNP